MHKALFIIEACLIAILLTGCRKDIVLQREMSFSAGMWDEPETKALTVTSSTITSVGGIKVHSYIMDGTTVGNLSTVYFADDLQYTSGEWNTTTTKYWPASTVGSTPSKSLNFFAYCPKNAVSSWNDDNLLSGVGYPSFTYTTPLLMADQNDLILASALAQTASAGVWTVNFSFKHLLTKVGIVTRIVGTSSSPVDVVLNSVKVSGVYPTATYNTNSGWGIATGSPMTLIASDSNISLTNEYQNVMGDNNYFFLIPQPLTDISLEVKYTIGSAPMVTREIPLASTQAWTAGKGIGLDITYTIDSNANIDLIFNVVDWENVTINTTIN